MADVSEKLYSQGMVYQFMGFEDFTEMQRDHGGFVLRSRRIGWEAENSHLIEYRLKLDSNPEFTSSVIVTFARAAYRLYSEG